MQELTVSVRCFSVSHHLLQIAHQFCDQLSFQLREVDIDNYFAKSKPPLLQSDVSELTFELTKAYFRHLK